MCCCSSGTYHHVQDRGASCQAPAPSLSLLRRADPRTLTLVPRGTHPPPSLLCLHTITHSVAHSLLPNPRYSKREGHHVTGQQVKTDNSLVHAAHNFRDINKARRIGLSTMAGREDMSRSELIICSRTTSAVLHDRGTPSSSSPPSWIAIIPGPGSSSPSARAWHASAAGSTPSPASLPSGI